MPLNYLNLDDRTRQFMLEEIDMDVSAQTIYLSSYLSDRGLADWAGLLRTAAQSGTDASLTQELQRFGRLKEMVPRRKPKGGGEILVRVPVTAHETMAEGEFNKYYVRGLCRRAIEDGVASLTVYRAKQVAVPRPESEQKIGTMIDPAAILADLRSITETGTTKYVEPALGMPPGPNSGLTLKLP